MLTKYTNCKNGSDAGGQNLAKTGIEKCVKWDNVYDLVSVAGKNVNIDPFDAKPLHPGVQRSSA